MFIDSHCHLHDRQFFSEEQAEVVLKRAQEAGVERIVCIGTDPEDSLAACEFAARHDNVYWTYGIHPEETSLKPESVFSSAGLEKSETSYAGRPGEPSASQTNLSASSGIYVPDFSNHFMLQKKQISGFTMPIAIGEVGLDYHYEGYDREAQIRLFEQMLQLASDNNLPLSFHVREAFADFFPVIANFPKARGVVHSFTDSKKVLKRILNETPFYVGVNGLATYSTLPLPPLDKILLETDAPFLAPVSHRGETNEPTFVPDIAKWLAAKLDLSIQEVAKTTTQNTEALFDI
ncbi:TatD family hydrolase [Candidatus Saccharibacteria bacterium]|nr:TatD family hydrolase [Candidatus Saccharibacteria bacterium]